MTVIPELAEACALRAKVDEHKASTVEQERAYRALLLQAVAKGATRAEIEAMCGFDRSRVATELRKARAETDDPKLKRAQLPHRGLTLGEYWCPEPGCIRAEQNGNEPLTSAQALSLHRVVVHDYRLGKNALTKTMVKKARADKTTPTSELARKWGVSYHALRSARAGKTWKSVPL